METIDLGLQALAARLTHTDPPLEVMIAGPTLAQAHDVLNALAAKVRVKARWHGVGRERLELDNGGSVTIASLASPSSLRGRSADLVVLVDRNDYTSKVLAMVAPVLVVREGKLAFL